mgnify:CR=1 FL=1
MGEQMEKDRITGVIYEESLSSMKKILDLGQFKIGDKNSREFSYFKSEVMNHFYGGLKNTFSAMEESGVVSKCNLCDADLRKGWKPCACRGSGYLSN